MKVRYNKLNVVPNHTELAKFVELVANLNLWQESDAYHEEGEGAQMSLDDLIAQGQLLESLINSARHILGQKP